MEHPRKRVVLLHVSGLHRIVGMFDSSVHTLREFVEFDQAQPLGGYKKTKARLRTTKPSYVIYQEVKS